MTKLTELDYEVVSLCNALLYTCHCGAIDMHGMALYEFFRESRVMTGIICRSCTASMLPEWLKA